MKSINTFVLWFVCFLFFSCTNKPLETIPDGSSAIDRIMAAQENAWNTGNIEGFMNGYWENDSLTFVGSKGLTNGYHQVLANYKRSYPDVDAMGSLSFNVLRKEKISSKAYHVLGKWTLFRTKDTLSGHYTLLWKYIDDEWRIVTDHSS